MTDKDALVRVLDEMAGPWPLDLVKELAGLAMRCMSIKIKPNRVLSIDIARVREELNEIKRKANDRFGKEEEEEEMHERWIGGFCRQGP